MNFTDLVHPIQILSYGQSQRCT